MNALPDWYCVESLETQEKKKKELSVNAESISKYTNEIELITTKEQLVTI